MSNAYLTEEQRADRLAHSYRQSNYSDYADDPGQTSRPNPRQSSHSQYSYSDPHPSHPRSSQSYHSQPHYSEPYTDRQSFDVRADFDGDGPRWSDLYGKKDGALMKDKEMGMGEEDYKRLDSHVAPSGQMMAYGSIDPMSYQYQLGSKGGYNKIEDTREELVSVPVLGPEWKRAEIHEMSRRGQNELKREKRSTAWKLWKRDQRGLCGVKWLTRQCLVFSMFAFCVALGITLYFLIPRPPNFEFYTDQPFNVDNSSIVFSRSPTNFSFAANLNLYADTSSSYLPVHFTALKATLYNLQTSKVIARGDYGNKKVNKGDQEPIILPVRFTYSALNDSDTTWNDMYNACGHIWPGTTRSDLKFRLELRSSIVGLVGSKFAQTSISDVTCPFELSANSV